MPTTGDVALCYYDGTRWRTDTELAATPVATYTPAAGLMLGRTGGKLAFLGATPVAQIASAAQAISVPAYGSMYDAGGATTAIGVATTYYKLGNTTTAEPLSSYTHAANRLTYTGATTIITKISVTATIGYSGGAGAKTLSLRVAKGGTTIAASQISRVLSAATDRGAIAFQCLVSLATNDYVELFGTNETDTQGLVVDRLYVIAQPVHDPTLENALRAALVTLGLIKGSV